MNRFTFRASDEQETKRLGAALAKVLPERSVISLCGPLGAGKTRLVQALAEACGIDRQEVTSPTFVLCQEYHGRRTIYHLDAYRVADADEFLQLGVEEYYDQSALTLIEWADRVADCLPLERLEIHIEPLDNHSRRFDILAIGERFENTIEALESALNR